jgi:hypothetical protein
MSNAHDSHGPDRYARHYVPERPVRARRLHTDVVRQVLAGGAVVVGVELVSEILLILGSLVGSLSGGFAAFAAIQLGFQVGCTILFAAVVALTVLYILPLGPSLDIGAVLSRVAVGGAIATVFLAGATIAWIALITGRLLGSGLISSGIMRPIATGLVDTALFALGVLIIRSMPDRPHHASVVESLPPAT